MEDNSPDKKSGCGLLNAVFGKRSFWPRRSTSTGSLPTVNAATNDFVKTPSTPSSRKRRGGSDDATFIDISTPEIPTKCVTKPSINQQKMPQKVPPSQCYVNQGKRVPREAIGISGELENIIADHQKSKGSSNLVRASSSNVMLFGNLGNLRQGGGGGTTTTSSYDVLNYLPKSAKEENFIPDGKYTNHGVTSVAKNAQKPRPGTETSVSLCRALSTRMDPETLKIMGNEDYKNGRFAEALALYDAAISIDPTKASYRSNKSAALTALGRLLEAIFECREAIRIEPHYHRAHHRLATLYLRLGDAEKAMYHYKHAGPEADPDDLTKAKTLQGHLSKCTEARRLRDWNTLIKETASAISAGADSAPQIYALQAEALIRLHRYQDADETMSKGPNFDVDDCTKFFGPVSNANLLMIRAQVDMAAGRFEDALEAAQQASRLDSNSREVNMVMRRARTVAAARSNGNELYKASRFSEACVAYGEGLEHDPYNSVLLCNRAACRSKLGQFEKAIEDCSAALSVRPSYSKARLRRADCNSKLEKWEAAIEDYEILVREREGEGDEVSQALLEAQLRLKKQRGEDVNDMKHCGPNSVLVS